MVYRGISDRKDKYQILTDKRYDFSDVQKLGIDSCDPVMFKVIMRKMPNLKEIFGSARIWQLDQLQACCETFLESEIMLEKLSIQVEMFRDFDSATQILDMLITKFVKCATIIVYVPEINGREFHEQT